MWAMVMKEFRQLRRDRRTLAMMIVVPLILLIVFGYAARFDVMNIPTKVVGPEADRVADELPDLFSVDETDPQAGEAGPRGGLSGGGGGGGGVGGRSKGVAP